MVSSAGEDDIFVKILIIKPSSFGDVIHTLPLVHSLKRNLPQAQITWLINRSYASFIRHCPLVAQTLDFDRKNASPFHSPVQFARFVFGEIPADEYDLVIDVQCLLRSGIFCWASKGKRKLGLQDGREGCKVFYHDIVRWPEGKRHAVERYLKVIHHLGLIEYPVSFPLDFPLGMPERLAQRCPDEFVVINPFSRGNYKRWRMSGFRNVIEQMPETTFILIGEEADRQESLLLESSNVINLVGQTNLVELAQVIQAGKCLLTNDSGPMHLAVALKKPVLALFGASDPDLTGPYGYPQDSLMRFDPEESLAQSMSPTQKAVSTEFSQEVIERLRRQMQI